MGRSKPQRSICVSVPGGQTLKIALLCLLAGAALALLFAFPANSAHAQQAYVGRYDVYAGFADIDSPMLGLNEHGFHLQAGINPRRWLSFGGDYSEGHGSQVLTPNLLPAATQTTIANEIAGLEAAHQLPAGYQLFVPATAATQTFAFGPQLAFRHYAKVTLFLRPSLGALRERAVPYSNPADPFEEGVVASLAPAGFKLDWTGFYGFGGGAEVAVSKHFGVRGQMDVVYNHPFNDILADGRWTYRYSVGPSFHFGRNMAAGGKKGR